MSEDMSRRYLTSAGSKVSSLKKYLSEHSLKDIPKTVKASVSPLTTPGDEQQSWKTWATQKIGLRRKGSFDSQNESKEVVNLFPGWAARRYPKEQAYGLNDLAIKPFEVDVFISGYAISHRSPENASRSQRAFIRLAKGFASLPKLATDLAEGTSNIIASTPLTPSTEELLARVTLPPRPTEITEDYEIQVLEKQLQRAKTNPESTDDLNSPVASRSSTCDDLPSTENVAPRPSTLNDQCRAQNLIRKMHANLESRLQPFWSSVLPNRTIRLLLFASPHQSPSPDSHTSDGDEISNTGDHRPLASQDVVTTVDGSFQARFRVKWDELCQHPMALHIAFGESIEEHDLLVVSQLLPNLSSNNTDHFSSHASFQADTTRLFPDHSRLNPKLQTPVVSSMLRIPITHCPIRVISDIDDTIKLSGVLSGARAVFHNVFVKELEENVIPEMGEWYNSMWSRGVRFHYVSNGPFEILPILNEFFKISQLPPGSIKLKSYAGRSLFNGLLSAPATRKRAGVVDVVEAFSDSRFFLVGDSGEQDLELYADLARDYPDRILGVFVRDVESGDPIDDTTGWKAIGAAGSRSKSDPLLPMDNGLASTPRPKTLSGFLSGKGSLSSPSKRGQIPELNLPTPSSGASGYFTSLQLTSEPEELNSDIGNRNLHPDDTPRPKSSTTLGASQIPVPASPSLCPPYISKSPGPIPSPTLTPSRASFRSSRTNSSTSSSTTGRSSLSEAEKKRAGLQARVYRARTQMPGHVVLRVFRQPNECVEVEEIMRREEGKQNEQSRATIPSLSKNT